MKAKEWAQIGLAAALIYWGAAGIYGMVRPKDPSEMLLRTDALTSCQYLVAPEGGITPRLDGAGRHICEPTPE